MEQGWDPEVKRFFKKIMSTFSFGLMWLIGALTGGLYFGLAYRSDVPAASVILFYLCLLGTLFLLVRYFYRLWKK
jgi:hypothetical protein